MTEADRLMTVREAADRLGRSENQLRIMLSKGTAPLSALIAGRRMFRASDVEAFIQLAFDSAEAVRSATPRPR